MLRKKCALGSIHLFPEWLKKITTKLLFKKTPDFIKPVFLVNTLFIMQ